jgi:hypothetical protein
VLLKKEGSTADVLLQKRKQDNYVAKIEIVGGETDAPL